jgi:UDP-glucose 4,6-dehydratase
MVLLLGASGYIGQAFQSELSKKNVDFLSISRQDYNYYDIDILINLIKETKAEFLINCAGYTGKPNVDACEKNREESYEANVELPMVIGAACAIGDIPWGHVSSGCIYDGNNGGNGFTEKDDANLTFKTYDFDDITKSELVDCSWYSATKAMSEECIERGQSADYYIWRLRIPFDENDGPRNYISKLMNYDKLLSLPNSVSHRGDFAKYCLELWLNKAEYGVYNVVNSGTVTAKEVVDKIKETLKIDKDFQFFEDEESFYEETGSVKRSNCILNNQKLIDSGVNVRTALEAIEESLEHWVKE